MLRPPLVATFLTALVVASPALAQVADADRATARMLAQQGQEALEAKDFAAAAERFARADALVHAPTLMLGLARAEVGQGRWVAALEHLSRIVREGVPAGSPPAWGKALQDAQKDLAALEPRMPAVNIRVVGPANARVTIDGAVVPAAALGVNRPVDPGKRVLRAEADGFAPAEVSITIAERKVEQVTLRIELPLAAPPGGVPPVAPAAGDGARGRSPLKIAGFVGIGLGGAGLVVGAITGGLALKKHGDLASVCKNGHCTNQQSAIDSYNMLGAISTAGFVAGGVLAATGIVLVAVAPRSKPQASAWIAPVIGAGRVSVEGGF